MGANTIAEVSGSITYKIDSKTTKNLDKFQRRLANVKKQMQGMTTAIKVQASVSERANKKVVAASKKAARQTSIMGYGAANADHIGAKSKNPTEIHKTQAKASRERIALAAKQAKAEGLINDRIAVKEYMMKNQLKGYRASGAITEKQQATQLKQLGLINAKYRKGASSVSMYNAKIQRLNKSTRNLANTNKGLLGSMKSMKGLMVGGIAMGVFGGMKNIMQTGQNFEDLTSSLMMVTGTLKGAKKEMSYVKNMANELGISSQTAADGYVKLAVAGKGALKQGDLKELFEGFSMFSTAAGANSFRQSKGLNALVQMMSKGKVQAEEFRGQLAEQIAGSAQVFYKAAGMSPKEFNKAMELGKLLPEELLPKVAKEFKKAAQAGGAFDQMMKNNSKRMQLFLNASADWKDEFFKGGFKDSLNYMFDSFAKILKLTKPLAKVLGSTLKGALNVLIAPFKLLGNTLEVIQDLFNYVAGDSLKFNDSVMTITGSIMGLVFAFGALKKAALLGYAAAAAPYVAFAAVMDDVHATLSTDRMGAIGEFINKPSSKWLSSLGREGTDARMNAYMDQKDALLEAKIRENKLNMNITVHEEGFKDLVKAEIVSEAGQNSDLVNEAFAN